MDHRVKKVISLMKEYLHRGWPASKLARFVNISPSRLHQLFKDETGLPPAKYQHLLRMEQAKELLETSYLSVKEVMAQVGVTDESHFVRDFKKSYGLTPAKYRERFRNGHQDESPQVGQRRRSSAPEQHPSHFDLKSSAHASLFSTPVAMPPILLRRASHPRHMAEDDAPLLRAKKKRELLSLIRFRHLAFAQLTTSITDNLARSLSTVRSIFYRPRRSATSRRLPPDAERRQVPQLPPPSSITPHISPSAARRKD